MNHHVHIIGASGFGKSVLLSHIIKNQIETKYHIVNYDINAETKSVELDISCPKFEANMKQNINAFFVQNNIFQLMLL